LHKKSYSLEFAQFIIPLTVARRSGSTPVERFWDKGAEIKRIEGLGCVKIKIY
jgi:hypothetical protein